MLNKENLTAAVRDTFPDLVRTNILFNNAEVLSFTEKTVLPFLVYQNTIDLNNRLIGLYLPENCNSAHIVPFYVILGHYRKSLNKIMQSNKYENISFGRNEKHVVFKSDVCSISSIDYINRKIVLKSGRGNESDVSFNESYKINWNYKNAFDIRDKIESFDRIDTANNHNIFTFPLSPSDNQYEGVVIFTNTSKFESILKNIKISGSDLRDHLNIQKAVLQYNDTWKFELLSKQKTSKKPISVLVARLDSFRALESIVKSNYEKLKHIKTVVIDEFDDLILQWNKKNSLESELSWIKNIYCSNLSDKKLKDVYLINKSKNLTIHDKLIENGISYFPWLVQPKEELILNGEMSQGTEIIIEETCPFKTEDSKGIFKNLLEKWKMLAINYNCQGEILGQINSLRILQSRINSYCDPSSLRIYLKQIEKSISDFKAKWFYNGLDYGLISETIEIIRTGLPDEKLNLNLHSVNKFIDLYGCQKKRVMVVSDNKIDEDRIYALEIILKRYPEIQIEFKDIAFTPREYVSKKRIFDLIIYLSYRSQMLKTALTNVLSEKQIFVLDQLNYNYAQSTSKKIQKLIQNVGSDQNKLILLNLSNSSTIFDFDNNGVIELKTINNSKDDQYKIEQIEAVDEQFHFEEFVHEIIGKMSLEKHSSNDNGNFYRIFFEDGSTRDFPENRRLFHFDENDHSEEISKYLKPIQDLNWGDEIIIPKRNEQLKELLESELLADETFAKSLKFDREWRKKIRSRLDWYNGDYSEFRKKMRLEGFSVESDLTVKNWLDNDTLRPHNFEKLLITLVKLKIINESDVPAVLLHNGKLKSIQISFVREAIKKLIAHLHGINYYSEETLIDQELLNKFIELVEVKRINSIIKL